MSKSDKEMHTYMILILIRVDHRPSDDVFGSIGTVQMVFLSGVYPTNHSSNLVVVVLVFVHVVLYYVEHAYLYLYIYIYYTY